MAGVGGVGYYQERGQAARRLVPGDVVEIPPEVEHWHGAAPDSWFSHLAIECNPNSNRNEWLDVVSDEQYNAATGNTPSARTQKVRLSKVRVDKNQLDEYNRFLKEEIADSMRWEPGVLTLYAVADKEDPSHITILEIYADEAAYKSHIQTPHFQKYKTETLEMVKELELTDTVPMIPGLGIKESF